MSGARPLRLGVLGAADIARRRTLPAVAAEPDVELVAVASRDPHRARRCTEVFGGEPMAGYAALLGRADIDAVYLPLPAALHARWIEAALDAGKHVLAEKPLTIRAADAHRLVASAAARGLVLAENYMFALHPQHACVAELIAAGMIGEVRGMRAAFTIPPLPAGDIRYRPEVGGGALADVGGYPLRASALLLGEPLEVIGATLRVDAARGVDLSGAALLSTPAGVISEVTFGMEHAYRAGYEVWGTGGTIRLERAYATPPDHVPVLHLRTRDDVRTRRLEPDDQFRRAVRAFAAAVRDGADSGLQGDDILRQADLVDRVRAVARRAEITGP
ncbi:Gfo/Idh/MocA family oxidoreductase [Amorphoplanes nipponensis]|uniref:Oxidoreductase n=1 Tax=Actinoplanes nipponensis TaxID=135950 RepID=A0A919MJE5_9ACTN|nr:oxidoreductase [Actinoplanes nipponensis]